MERKFMRLQYESDRVLGISVSLKNSTWAAIDTLSNNRSSLIREIVEKDPRIIELTKKIRKEESK